MAKGRWRAWRAGWMRRGGLPPWRASRSARRIPVRLADALLCIRSEDHYLRLYTAAGSELILMRLSDAVAELAGIDGLQVHRCYWVARAAVRRVARENRRTVLHLGNGLAVPVSATYLPALRAAGWLNADGPSTTAPPLRPTAWRRPALAAAGVLAVAMMSFAAAYTPQPSIAPLIVATAEGTAEAAGAVSIRPVAIAAGTARGAELAAGLIDDLSTDLARIPGLTVRRGPGDGLPGAEDDERGARLVLEGRARGDGAQLRVTLRLIDSRTGDHLWAERFDGVADRMLVLQDRAARAATAAIAAHLSAAGPELALRAETPSAAAYDAFVQGWAHYLQDTPEGFAAAAPYFRRAVALDPDYGRAYAALASLYYLGTVRGWNRQWGLSRYQSFRYAHEFLLEAIDRPTAMAYAIEAQMRLTNHQHEAALAQARRAVSTDPRDPYGNLWMANTLIMGGRPQEAVDYVARVMRQQPHYPPSALWYLGLAHFGMEHYEEAAVFFERARERSPQLSGVPLAAAYAHLGRLEDARRVLNGQRRTLPRGYSISVRSMTDGFSFKRPADAQRLAEGLRLAGLN